LSNNTMIIAHRGESYDAPENTLASINLAWERGATAVECDVHLSKDNEIVIIHDDNTLRTTGIDKMVSQQSYDELKQHDAGKWKGPKWDGVKIPTLEEALETIPTNGKLLVEIKCDAKIIPILKNVLDNSKVEKEQIIIMDFNYRTVSEMRKVFPGYEILWLSTMRKKKFFHIPVHGLISKTLNAGLDGLNVLNQSRVNAELVDKVKSAGLKLYVWTVDDPTEIKRLIDLGVDGIATNRAKWMKNNLQIEHGSRGFD